MNETPCQLSCDPIQFACNSQHAETQFRLRSQIRHLNDETPRLEKRLQEIRQDTRSDVFVIQIDGQSVRDRGIGGELLLRHATRMRGSHAERLVGQFAGFQVLIADNFMSGPEIVLKGAGTHLAKATDTALGTMRSVEYVIQNLDETAATVEHRIAQTRKRIFDLQVQTAQPFEYEARLALLSRRQDEIEDALDLTKGQAAAELDARMTDEPVEGDAAASDVGETSDEAVATVCT